MKRNSWILCLAAALTLLCLAGCAGDAAPETTAASTAPTVTSVTATTMSLEKYQGTLEIQDPAQAPIPAREGMQLYSGYQLATGLESLSWISLDDTKSVKLAEQSSAAVMQANKDLELTLHSGSLFFNVTRPLDADESLNIRTATMVTGIRGTCGWVHAIDAHTTQVALLEGHVAIEYTSPQTGQPQQIPLDAGQILTFVSYDEDAPLTEEEGIQELIEDGTIIPDNVIREEFGLRVEALAEENVPGYIQEEVAASEALQQRIEEESPLSVEKILGTEETPEQAPSNEDAEDTAEWPKETEAPEEPERPPEPPLETTRPDDVPDVPNLDVPKETEVPEEPERLPEPPLETAEMDRAEDIPPTTEYAEAPESDNSSQDAADTPPANENTPANGSEDTWTPNDPIGNTPVIDEGSSGSIYDSSADPYQDGEDAELPVT